MNDNSSFDLTSRRRTKPVPAKVEDHDPVDGVTALDSNTAPERTGKDSEPEASTESAHHLPQKITHDPIEYMDVSVSTRILMRYKLMIDEEVLARKKDPSRGPAKIRSVLEHALENTYGEGIP